MGEHHVDTSPKLMLACRTVCLKTSGAPHGLLGDTKDVIVFIIDAARQQDLKATC